MHTRTHARTTHARTHAHMHTRTYRDIGTYGRMYRRLIYGFIHPGLICPSTSGPDELAYVMERMWKHMWSCKNCTCHIQKSIDDIQSNEKLAEYGMCNRFPMRAGLLTTPEWADESHRVSAIFEISLWKLNGRGVPLLNSSHFKSYLSDNFHSNVTNHFPFWF